MTRRWWGGPGISVVLHAALMTILIWAAARPSRLDATPAIASTRTKFVYTVGPRLEAGPGVSRKGAGNPLATTPRMVRAPETQLLNVTAPSAITSVEPTPVAAVPAIVTQDIDIVPGAPMPADGTTTGKGSGTGGGGGHGTGYGPGDGSGEGGDVYEPGVGGVTAPALSREVRPNYTVDAMRAKIQGVVLMAVVVLADGSVDPARIRITHSLDRGLDEQAVIAVRQWRFRPSLRLGQPVASRVIVEIGFTLR